ncbi:hypothetical protein MMC34_008154 [Xylographa carneopallida]|nr:hypothetical protein [Xylographa carneopallida]
MPLHTIYLTRHGYRSNWTTDHLTGHTTSIVRSPTNIPSDPALSAYGVQQAAQLASQAQLLTPPILRIYSSPFYRCLQTITPLAERLGRKVPLICDRGLGTVLFQSLSEAAQAVIAHNPHRSEWYGTARFTHPSPAALPLLLTFFPTLTERTTVVPSPNGESIDDLHDRCAVALAAIIADCDAEASADGAIVICTHAATMIAIGRVLTGVMPADVAERDFHAYTCSISKFERMGPVKGAGRGEWRGDGVSGEWRCVVDAGTGHLSGGAERDW